jgi:hypothetical protein
MDLDSRVNPSPVNFFFSRRTGYKVGFANSASGMVKWGNRQRVVEENKVIRVGVSKGLPPGKSETVTPPLLYRFF